jgi:hypothetical protein
VAESVKSNQRKKSRSQEQPVSFAQDQHLMAGEPTTLTASLHVPLDAPTTFLAAHNSLLWLVNVPVKLRGWPDWTHEVPLIVRP